MVNAAWDADEIADAVATGVVHSLARQMLGSGDGINAIRSTAVRIISRNMCSIAWTTPPTAGITPASKAFACCRPVRHYCTAFTADPALGLSAMQQLPRSARRRAAEAMTTADCRRVLDEFGLLADRGIFGAALGAVAEEWNDGHRPDREDAAAVWLFATVSSNALGGATLERAVNLFVQTAAAQKRPDRDELPAGSLRTDVLKALGGDRTKIESTRWWTSAGGVFLLLPDVDVEHFDQLPWRLADDEAVNARCLAILTLGVALNDTWSPALWRRPGPHRSVSDLGQHRPLTMLVDGDRGRASGDLRSCRSDARSFRAQASGIFRVYAGVSQVQRAQRDRRY